MKKYCLILSAGFLIGHAALMSETKLHTYPRICPQSAEYTVQVNGQKAFVFAAAADNFISFETDSLVNIHLVTTDKADFTILPRRLNIDPVKNDNALSFSLPAGEKCLIEISGHTSLHVYNNPILKSKPDSRAPGMHYFESGQLYEAGTISLKDNETLFIEGGAVVRGRIRTNSAKNVTVNGYGVLDGGYFSKHGIGGHFARFHDCRNIEVKNIIMIEPPGWMLVLSHSENIRVDNIKQLGDGHGTDGIDIVCSRQVQIENCMLRNGDDCVVVKSFKRDKYPEPVQNQISGPEDIQVKHCLVQSNGGGQAFEIGHELIINPVRNISFVDCDVLGVHGQGGVFGIHNCDGATVENVRYENIRVDHYYNKLIDIRIIKSRWSKEDKIGHVKNVILKNIFVTNSIYNPGYSISLIGGYDETHKIENVQIENFTINGKPITTFDQLDLYLKQTKNVIISHSL